jgi:hypothetical protein
MRERKRITRLLLTDVTVTRTSDTITAHIRLTGGQTRTLTLPVPGPAWNIRQTKASTIAKRYGVPPGGRVHLGGRGRLDAYREVAERRRRQRA